MEALNRVVTFPRLWWQLRYCIWRLAGVLHSSIKTSPCLKTLTSMTVEQHLPFSHWWLSYVVTDQSLTKSLAVRQMKSPAHFERTATPSFCSFIWPYSNMEFKLLLDQIAIIVQRTHATLQGSWACAHWNQWRKWLLFSEKNLTSTQRVSINPALWVHISWLKQYYFYPNVSVHLTHKRKKERRSSMCSLQEQK